MTIMRIMILALGVPRIRQKKALKETRENKYNARSAFEGVFRD